MRDAVEAQCATSAALRFHEWGAETWAEKFDGQTDTEMNVSADGAGYGKSSLLMFTALKYCEIKPFNTLCSKTHRVFSQLLKCVCQRLALNEAAPQRQTTPSTGRAEELKKCLQV